MRSIPFPRRIQLVKLLRSHGLRDVERMREDELKEALEHLNALVPPVEAMAMAESHPSSSELMRAHTAFPATPEPEIDESFDDPHALPRFREPRLHLPDEARTFLRAIAVKPGLLFFTWDVEARARQNLEGPVELQVFARDFLGAAPKAHEVLAGDPVERLPIELSARGWYLPTTRERAAVAGALVVVGERPRRLAESNVALCPPSRPAPPGPLWMATLPPWVDRRKLARGELMGALEGGWLPDGASIQRHGEADAEAWAEGDLPASSARARAAALRAAAQGPLPTSGMLPSSQELVSRFTPESPSSSSGPGRSGGKQ